MNELRILPDRLGVIRSANNCNNDGVPQVWQDKTVSETDIPAHISICKFYKQCAEDLQGSQPIKASNTMLSVDYKCRRLAYCLYLACENTVHLKMHKGQLCIAFIEGTMATADIINKTIFYHSGSDENLVYSYLLKYNKFPNGFVDSIIKPHLRECIDSIDRVEETSGGQQDISDSTTSKTTEQTINQLFKKFNIKKNCDSTMSAFQFAQIEYEAKTFKNQIVDSLTTRTDTQQAQGDEGENFQATPPVATSTSSTAPTIKMKKVDTSHYLSDDYRKFIHKLALQTPASSGRRFICFLDTVSQWCLRNKRIFFFNVLDMVVGGLVTSFIMGPIGGPIYVISALGTLATWFVYDTIALKIKQIYYLRTDKLRKKIKNLEIKLQEALNRVEVDSVDTQNQNANEQMSKLVTDLKASLLEKKRALLKGLTFLSGEIYVTKVLIKERREYDRLAKIVNKLKMEASQTFEKSMRYETALATLERQETMLQKHLSIMTEANILAMELYTQEKHETEKHLSRLLDKTQLNIFKDVSDQELTTMFTNGIVNNCNPNRPNIFKRIWWFLHKPTTIATLTEDALKNNQHEERSVIAALQKMTQKLSSEQLHCGESDDTTPTVNPNQMVAELFDRMKNTDPINHEIAQQVERETEEVIYNVAKQSWNLIPKYISYYLMRIPYRMHEAGTTWALMSGVTVSFSKLLQAAFPSPIALGGLGIILWMCIRQAGLKIEEKNDEINARVCDNRIKFINKFYADDNTNTETENNTETARTAVNNNTESVQNDSVSESENSKEENYFNIGIHKHNSLANIYEGEWRAIRRQAKNSSSEICGLIKNMLHVKIELAKKIEEALQDTSNDNLQHLCEHVSYLLIYYSLINDKLESSMLKQNMASYECIRHVHKTSMQSKLLYSAVQQSDQPQQEG